MSSQKRSRDEEINFGEVFELLEEQQSELEFRTRKYDLIPSGWRALERTAPITAPKTKLTLSLDADMVTWFRDLGRGYQPRMNAVLRAYMHAVIAKEIARKGSRDWRGQAI